MGHYIVRGRKGYYLEYYQWFMSTWGEPREVRRLVGHGVLTKKQRALLAMGKAERRGRTKSWAYSLAKKIALKECFGYCEPHGGHPLAPES